MAASEPVDIYGPDPQMPTVRQLVYLSLPTMLGTAAVNWVLYTYYIDNQVIAGIVSLLIVAIPLGLSLGWTYKKWNAIEYRVFQDQVEKKKGVFSTTKRTTKYDEITDVKKTRTFFERQLDLADIEIQTAGQEKPAITMRYLGDPTTVYDQINTRAD
jgi:uncharacterized membrane protein YdbT with pleckstrin-like domain